MSCESRNEYIAVQRRRYSKAGKVPPRPPGCLFFAVAARGARTPLLFQAKRAGLQVGGLELAEPPFRDAQLLRPCLRRNVALAKLRHHEPDESVTVAPTQLLMCFFSFPHDRARGFAPQ